MYYYKTKSIKKYLKVNLFYFYARKIIYLYGTKFGRLPKDIILNCETLYWSINLFVRQPLIETKYCYKGDNIF